MSSTIKAFDHATTVLSQNLRVCDVPLVDTEADIVSADIAICHQPDDNWWHRVMSASKPGTIRVRTSSAGRVGHQHQIANGVIMLELQISHNPELGGITVAQWSEIIAELEKEDVALRIVQGDMSAALMKYFGTLTPQFLPALSILCQGYLLAYAGWRRPVDVAEASVVSEALAKMGWDSTCETVVTGHEVGKLPSDVVVTPEFWDVFGVEQEPDQKKRVETLRKTVLATVEKEWGQTGDPGFGPIQVLIGMIGCEINDPIPVARAYLGLAKRLGSPNVI